MKNEKTHWKKQFNYDYLGSWSLPDGKDIILTIEKVVKKEIKNQKGEADDRPVIYFKEKNDWILPMILNKENCVTIENVYGSPFIEDWAGKQIQIGISRIKAFGDEMDALRIRRKVPVVALPESGELFDNAVQYLKTDPNASIKNIEKRYSVSENVKSKLMEAIENENS